MSPMREQQSTSGLRPTNHTDYGVAPNRPDGKILDGRQRASPKPANFLGPDQRISPLEGLKGITIPHRPIYMEKENSTAR